MLTNSNLLTNDTSSIQTTDPATVSNTLTVADSTARLALTYGTGTGQVQIGDLVRQTDTGVVYLLVGDTPSNAAHWQQVSALPASILASGQVALARGGTGADLSATGGTGQVLKQSTAGEAITVGIIDLARGAAGSGTNVPGGDLYLDAGPGTGNAATGTGRLRATSAGSSGSTVQSSWINALTWGRSEVVLGLSLRTADTGINLNYQGSLAPASGGYTRLSGSTGIHFNAASSDRAYLSSSGLGINTAGVASARKLEVVDSAAAQVRFTHTAGSNYAEIRQSTSGFNLTTTTHEIGIGGALPGLQGTLVGYGSSGGAYCTGLGYIAAPSGTFSVALGFAAAASATSSIAIGRGSIAAIANTCMIGGPDSQIDTIFAGKGAPHATPTAWGIQGTSGLGTNIGGGACHLRGGRPTGSGLGGSAILQTAPPGSSSATLQTLVDRLEADTHGVIWIHPVTTAPTVGRANQIGLFSDAGVLKFIKPDNTVITVPES